MKLNWFSPLPPAATGIAEYTGTILPWLCSQADITLWTDQAAWDAGIEKHAAVRRYSHAEIPWEELNDGVTVYHIGNNPEFHRGIWEVSQQHAGIVVLHDLRLQDFFWAIFAEDPEAYASLMESVYGMAGANAARALGDGEKDLASLCVEFSLAEAAIQNALGVVVHTPGGFELLTDKCRPLLGYLPFPYAAASDATLAAWEKRRKRPAKSPYKLVLTGYINPNRRLNSILQVLAEIPARGQFRLSVYGPVWHEEHIRDTIASFNLGKIVTLHGYTPPSELNNAIADADLAINLRHPTMGEASMSQLQVWDHRLPSIVTRTGWYGTLPEDTVLFVEPDREMEDLKRHITAFTENPGFFAALGERGRKVLLDQHGPKQYASDLIGFLKQAVKYRVTAAFMKTSQRTASTMQGWIRPLAAEHAAERLAATIMEFLPK